MKCDFCHVTHEGACPSNALNSAIQFKQAKDESAFYEAQWNAKVQAAPVRPGAAAKIRERIADLRLQRANYLAYQQDRVRERDHHGAWDVAINLSEVECELAGLEFALQAIEAEHGA